MEADDQVIQTILLGLPEDIYAKLFNERERFTSTDRESIESYYHRFSKLMNYFNRDKHFPEKIANYTQLYDFLKYNQKEVDDLKPEQLPKTQDPLALMENVRNQKRVIVVSRIAKQNGNGNVVVAQAEGNANGNNDEHYNELLELIPEPHQVPHNDSNVISEVSSVEQGGVTVKQHSATVEETRVYHESLFHNLSAKVEKQAQQKQQSLYNGKVLLEKYDPPAMCDSEETLELAQENTSNLQTELERTKECFENFIIKKENEYAKLWNDWYKKCEECKYEKISYDKTYNDMQQKIKRLQAQLGDQKDKSKDNPCVSDTLDLLPQKHENENVELDFQVYMTNDLSNPVTLNSVPTTKESKVVENDKVIAPGMFRINPFMYSREEKFVPNKPIKASVRINPITAPQPYVITKKVVNSDSNGFSFIGVDITTKTRSPQPRSNTKNDTFHSASKNSRIKNKKLK
nr:hypothetical protein [Tanacetum cinerariifolium]